MSKYQILKDNIIYKNRKDYYSDSNFYEFILATWIALEKDDIYGPLQFVKFVKDETGLGLKICKEWYDMLRDLGFIIIDFNIPIFEIKPYVKEISSLNDLVYMIDHKLNVEQFLRITKLKNITKRIENGKS